MARPRFYGSGPGHQKNFYATSPEQVRGGAIERVHCLICKRRCKLNDAREYPLRSAQRKLEKTCPFLRSHLARDLPCQFNPKA